MTPSNDVYATTYRTEGHHQRNPVRYGRDEVHAVLAEGYICHVGFQYTPKDSKLAPYTAVTPTLYGFKDEVLYLHGATGTEWRLYDMATRAKEGADVCLTVSLVQSLVLGPTALHHAVDYRSVVVYGKAVPVTDTAAKRDALRIVMDQVIPGRWSDTTPPTDAELAFTGVLRIDVKEASVKSRTGFALEAAKCGVDHESSANDSAWQGQLPVQEVYGPPINDRAVPPTTPTPDYVKYYHRPKP
ncbi:pyridoxamine 5'-phosphate oxidase family protein [Streptomyces noursei]|uniref:pyridoxamine 5'-phosphate oxidase family protein n=1 Tax=Streptomyces noursei TaxID=1971 RepID=UPI0033FCDAC0